MSTNISWEARALHFGDELFKNSTWTRATDFDFDHAENVILIHGFTAHGLYMKSLASTFDAYGFNSFVFNYDSYRGIESAAKSLNALLFEINNLSKIRTLSEGVLAQRKCSLVCHSMGGLVARAILYESGGELFVKRIVTLGTPHRGTLDNSRVIEYFLKWAEHIAGAFPHATAKSCASAHELTRTDNSPALLDRLTCANSNAQRIPILSISGGKRWLEFGKSRFFNAIYNQHVQRLLGPGDNDGLVTEKSSTLGDQAYSSCLPDGAHFRDYPEYDKINHSNLVENQDLCNRIMVWLRRGEAAVNAT